MEFRALFLKSAKQLFEFLPHDGKVALRLTNCLPFLHRLVSPAHAARPPTTDQTRSATDCTRSDSSSILHETLATSSGRAARGRWSLDQLPLVQRSVPHQTRHLGHCTLVILYWKGTELTPSTFCSATCLLEWTRKLSRRASKQLSLLQILRYRSKLSRSHREQRMEVLLRGSVGTDLPRKERTSKWRMRRCSCTLSSWL